MSYLLDALRKSEDLKNRGAPPNIHSADRYEHANGKSRWIGMTLLIILPMILILAWYGFRSSMVDEATRPQITDKKEEVAADHERAPPPRITPEDAPGKPAQTVDSVAKVRLTTERTPVERLEAPPASNEQSVTQVSVDAETGQEPTSAVVSGPVEAEREATAQVTAARPSEQGLSIQAPASTTQAAEFESARPGLINIWELPENVRSELIEMRISVLVFAERPEDRFMLMNGKRWVEGDEPQSGLILKEIRREGAVFSYRLYHFLVSQ